MSNIEETNAHPGHSVITEIEVPVTEDCGHVRIPAEAFYRLSHKDTGQAELSAGIGKPRTRSGFILIPEFQSMTKMLFKNYRLRLFSYTNLQVIT